MKMLINGKLEDKDEKIAVINPFNSEVVDEVPMGSLKDVKKAITAANQSSKVLAKMSSRKLSRIMQDIHQDLKENMNDMARLITMETGKTIRDSQVEMQRSLETILFSAEECKRIYGETIPMDAALAGKSVFGFTIKIPLGIVGAITPSNYPVNLAIHKLAPAMAAKNTMVFKPSIQAPLAALKMAQIMDTHLPPGIVNCVTGQSSLIGDEIVTSPLINKISFTGSVPIGLAISRKAGLKNLTLELGGNDPLIVLDDADIDGAVTAAVAGSYLNAGQVCIAVERIIIQENVAEDFVEGLVKKTKKLRVGDPMNPKTDVGPLINEQAALMVEIKVDDAVKEGAELLCGGERKGSFYYPTVMDQAHSEMEVVRDETFGPVSPIIRVKTEEEAYKVANDTKYGLQAGVFTQSIDRAKRAVQSIEAGSVLINKQSTFRTDNMPFGGFKMSGIGKEGVKYAVDDMTRTKMVVIG
ncbi:MAG: lactaldehyde dehydrogenase [Methanobacteriales archaeon Met13]